jgi:hypothetical protein
MKFVHLHVPIYINNNRKCTLRGTYINLLLLIQLRLLLLLFLTNKKVKSEFSRENEELLCPQI